MTTYGKTAVLPSNRYAHCVHGSQSSRRSGLSRPDQSLSNTMHISHHSQRRKFSFLFYPLFFLSRDAFLVEPPPQYLPI